MKDLSPKPGDLSAIETASRDEIEALQLERMRWLQQIYNMRFKNTDSNIHQKINPDFN